MLYVVDAAKHLVFITFILNIFMKTNHRALKKGAAVFIFANLLKTSCFKQVRLVGQSLSALCTASLQNGSAVRSLHSLSEAMLLFSLTLLRLISSEHLLHLLT